MYSFSGSTSSHVATALAERGLSITPNIYNDLGEMGLDATGKYACSHIALAQIEFGQTAKPDRKIFMLRRAI